MLSTSAATSAAAQTLTPSTSMQSHASTTATAVIHLRVGNTGNRRCCRTNICRYGCIGRQLMQLRRVGFSLTPGVQVRRLQSAAGLSVCSTSNATSLLLLHLCCAYILPISDSSSAPVAPLLMLLLGPLQHPSALVYCCCCCSWLHLVSVTLRQGPREAAAYSKSVMPEVVCISYTIPAAVYCHSAQFHIPTMHTIPPIAQMSPLSGSRSLISCQLLSTTCSG